jgi:hypothetical protein
MATGMTKVPVFHNHSKGAKRADPLASMLTAAYPHVASHNTADTAEKSAPVPASRPGRPERATTAP